MVRAKKMPKERLTLEQAKKKPVAAAPVAPAGNGSRASLMEQAKASGIKYYRIMSKENLKKMLAPETTILEKHDITVAAIAKWKGGWGKKSKTT